METNMLTDEDRKYILDVNAKLDRLEAAGKHEAAERLIEKNRAAFSLYSVRDGKVFYTGHVANENGWTP
jgi:hypothetical protein